MDSILLRALFWAPRVLCILFALFLSIFAADVFGENQGFRATAVALFMHLIPVFVVLLALALAWRHELFGAGIFVALGVLYVATMGVRMHWSASALIGGPLLLIGFLFVSHWWLGRGAHPHVAPR